MFALWRFRDSSGKILGLIALGLLVRYVGGWAIQWGFEQEGGRHGSSPSAPSAMVDPDKPAVLRDVESAVAESTIPTIRLDGGVPDDALLSPMSAALAFGGVVLLVGGVGAVALWRRAESGPEE